MSAAAGPTWPQALEHERLTDSINEDTTRRVVMLELALVDRRIRRRLRREIRQGQKDFAWVGPEPEWRRAEAAHVAWLCRDRRSAA